MPFNPRRKPHAEQQRQHARDAIDFAWRVHNAQEGWTSKVDTKASILLALEGGSLFAILAANSDRGAFRLVTGAGLIIEVVGVGLLLVSVLCSATAVLPRLGSVKQHKQYHRQHLIYFGQLRHWQPDRLADALQNRNCKDQLDMLALQLIAMSTRNWRKHRLVQISLLAALLGLGTIAAALTSIGASS